MLEPDHSGKGVCPVAHLIPEDGELVLDMFQNNVHKLHLSFSNELRFLHFDCVENFTQSEDTK